MDASKWINRWIHLLYRSAKSTRRIRTLLTPVGIVVFGLFVTLFIAAALLTDKILGLPPLLPGSVATAISIPLMTVGVAVTAWSAFHFLRVKGTPVPFNPPPKVVASGPYRHTRNPMLTGVFLMLFGLGFQLTSISLVFLFTPLFIAANAWELKHIEEPELVRRLGEEYREYRKRTPMFWPGHSRG